jgi:hypothetical protein
VDRSKRWLAMVLILPAAGVSACGTGSDSHGANAGEGEPARVEPVKGSDVARITLTAEAAHRLGIETGTTGTSAGPGGKRGETIPYAALLYDAEGHTFTYTNPERLVFIRHSVTVREVKGPLALLTSGPPAGTRVVTVGAAELLGTEYGVEE